MSLRAIGRPLFAALLLCLVGTRVPSAHALNTLNNSTIDGAVRYGLEHREEGLSTYLGGNWVEGPDGALINIYTPFMTIARSASRLQMTTKPTPEDVSTARGKIKRDIEYTFQHPSVKFMVSLYGDTSDFGKHYFAMIEGAGRGHSVTVYPTTSIPQFKATEEPGAKVKPFTVINTYVFSFEDLAPLDEMTLKLYGKNIEPIRFRMINRELQ